MSTQDTPAGETATNETKPLENNANPPAPTTGNAGIDEAERLRKELEKAQMRNNQLQNQLDETAAEKAERERKELEEQQRYKELAEQERVRREALEAEVEEEKRKAAVEAATQQVFADYNDDVVELAKETGLSLTDASEESQASLKAKLDKLADRIQASASPAPTNPNPSNPQPTAQGAMDNYIANRRGPNEMKAWEELVKHVPSIAQQMRQD